jgi:hypothetical protein
MPNSFAGIDVGDRVLANGYAALMELSYYSDHRTEYSAQFSASLADEVRDSRPPYDFTYLVGTKNGEVDFTLDAIRETIAQNLFLDMTSDFAPHKRSIRDNMKGKWAQQDPEGRGYSKQFMSFGLSSIEIPITQIRASMANRLAKDLLTWWLNESSELPPQMLELVRGDLLKRNRLTDMEMLADVLAANDRSYLEEIANWVNGLRDKISNDKLLGCTSQGANMFGSENGKILQFLSFLKPEVENYRAEHLRELSPDERQHGDFLKKMYANRDEVIKRGRTALETELYGILSDRSRGPKFADHFIATVRQVFDDTAEKFRREQDKTWAPNETNRQHQYEAALQDIAHFQDKFGLRKEAQMEEYWDAASEGLQGMLTALLQRKSRALGLEVVIRLQEHLTRLETRFSSYTQRLIQARDYFNQRAQQEVDSADALKINGYKLFDRQEINFLYQDFLEQLAGASEGSKRRDEMGLDRICSKLSEQTLKQASPLWKDSRQADEVMRLFDLTEIPIVQEDDLRELIFGLTRKEIEEAPEGCRLRNDLSASDRMMRSFPDSNDLVNNLRIAYQKSNPLLILSRGIINQNRALLEPAMNSNVAILGGRNSSDAASQRLLIQMQEFVKSEENIKPLGKNESHRIIFVQEMGGFSLRCVEGMSELRKHYQNWKGESIAAKRAQLRGESRELPIPVHMTKEPPFWDIFPEDPEVLRLVVHARALGVLKQEVNQRTEERYVRYVLSTVIGDEKIDLANTWDETVQVLEVLACRDDRQAIDKQVKQKLAAAETPEQKQFISGQLMSYLVTRAEELEAQKLGGKDSPIYKRESDIIRRLFEEYRLPTSTDTPPDPLEPPAPDDKKNDFFEKIMRLKQMKNEGLLTEEEFTIAKTRLLNG